ncbi:MAG TPA: hypothetical protein VF844_02260 [Ktedonobacteraceae bacterium]
MDMPAQRFSRRLQRTLLAFFCLSVLFLLVVYVAAPSIYTNTLSLLPSPTGHSPVAATLLLVGVGVFLAIVMVGVLRRWPWVFWLVLVAFGGMILDLPVTLLQLSRILPALFPLWYSLCRMGASLIAVGIAVWMFQLYQRYGVWARGRKAPSGAHTHDEKEEVIKEKQ